jgi:hypothetical protein
VRSKQNVTFTVLEARNETGGRTRAMTFGDASVGRYVLERGSNWVCGVGGGTGGQRVTPPAPDIRTNPILDFVLRQPGSRRRTRGCGRSQDHEALGHGLHTQAAS